MRGNDALPLALLEQALNHNLRDSPAATRLLDRLHGHILALHLRELDRTLHLRAHPAGIQVLVATEQPADARLSGTLAGLTRLAAGASTGRLPPGVSLGGAAEVAEGFQQLLTLARPDFETLLSRALGDALTMAGVIKDDARITTWHATKTYHPQGWTGAHITIERNPNANKEIA